MLQPNHTKIPPTIISRAQRFDFKAIGTEQITDRLRFVAEEQQLDYDNEDLSLLRKHLKVECEMH